MLPMSSRSDAVRLGLHRPDGAQGQRVLLFRLLLANAAELRRRMDRLLAESGLTTQQAMVLQFLQGEPEPPTLAQFAHRLAMTHQNLKQIVVAMERKGLVKLLVDENDRRVRRLHLTARHTRLWQERDPTDHAEVAGWTHALTNEEVRAVVRALDALHESLMRERNA